MESRFFYKLFLPFVLLNCNITNAANLNNPIKKEIKKSFIGKKSNPTIGNEAPILTATSNQTYCPLASINIATSFTITDPDDTSTDAIYIQISSGYNNLQDRLILNNPGSHPTLTASWNATEGKLTLKSPTGIPVSYTDFESAIQDIQFTNSSATPSGIRNFSISIGQANYLPRNGHYYEYVPNLGVTWTSAKALAQARTYYGLRGYLATITADDEAQLAGKQAPGAGWIGGSDAETEGIWKWVTGPEAGTIFWNGLSNGSTPNFAFWNTNEPNQSGDEDYAHITTPEVGISGSWNDLSDSGSPSGDYQPKGYIVEYGGMPGDPALHLSVSTTLTVSTITSTTAASRCDAGSIILQATASAGTINWYDAAVGGNYIASGSSFNTPAINLTTTYYVETSSPSCTSSRTAVEAKVNVTPTIINTNTPSPNCGPGVFTLNGTTSVGIINWYAQLGGTVVSTGLTYTTPQVTGNTTYYAEAINNGCTNGTKTPIDVIVYPLPEVADQEVFHCVNTVIVLDAGLKNMNYAWSTGETTQTIEVLDKGIYTVDVTSLAPESCTSRKKITVVENNKPEIKNVIVDDTTVTIELVKSESYFEYSIDGINFQSSNIFINAPSGLQIAQVREINQCSTDSKSFVVIIVPKFFTPNNDTYNDVWEVDALINYPLSSVTIFDRYGKLITKLNAANRSWDGTYNQNPLPSSDYWYVIEIDNETPIVKGHFSLKR